MSSSLYSLTSTVPLIKSPSLRLLALITFPQDLHPLPPDITAYFVYPFSLESYVLSDYSPNSKTLSSLHSKHTEYLAFRKAEKERIRKEEVKRLAPGFEEDRGVLKPDIKAKGTEIEAKEEKVQEMVKEQRDVMDDLVDHLAALDSNSTNTSTSVLPPPSSLVNQDSQLPPPPPPTGTSWQGSI